MNHMKDALARRRGKGLDIHILVGGGDPKQEEKQSDLAPENKAEMMEEMSESPDHQMAEKEGMDEAMDAIAQEKQNEDEFMHPDLEAMSEMDKTTLMGRKPRSLHERAMQNHLGKMSKK